MIKLGDLSLNYYIFFFGIIIIIASLILFFVLSLKYIFYKFLRKFMNEQKASIISYLIPILSGYYIYLGFYPPDSFYLNEFEEIVQEQNIPKVKVIYGNATYPTFHPDYCSAALLRLQPIEFNAILRKIKNNNYFFESSPTGSSALYAVLDKTETNENLYKYKASTQLDNKYFFIGFLPENKILFHKCEE
jgi:hypothetical protein